MSYQERLIAATQTAVDALFRTVRAMPEDKLTWSPLDQGRTALGMLQECSQSPLWGVMMIEEKPLDTYTPEFFERVVEERKQWTTVDKCEEVCRANCEKLYAAIRSIPDDTLDKMVPLPFGEHMQWPLSVVIALQYWNTTYHTGQINYIQTLYGDKEMH